MESQGLLEEEPPKDDGIEVGWEDSLVSQSGIRICTDIVFLVLFILSIVSVSTLLKVNAFDKGDIRKFRHGQDHDGYTCGVDGPVKGFPYVYWPHQAPTEGSNQTDILKSDSIKGMILSLDHKHQRAVCTSTCPDGVAETRPNLCPKKDMQYCNWYAGKTSLHRGRWCVFHDPFGDNGGATDCLHPTKVMQKIQEERSGAAKTHVANARSAAPPGIQADLDKVQNILDDQDYEFDELIKHEDNNHNTCKSRIPGGKSFFDILEDILDETDVIIYGSLVTVGIALFYMLLLSCCAKIMLIGSLVALLGGFLAGTFLCLAAKNEADEKDLDSTYPLLGVIAFALASAFALFFLGGFFFKASSAAVAITLLQISLSFLVSVPSLIVLGVLTMAAQLGTLVLLVWGILLLASTTAVKPADHASDEGGRYEFTWDMIAQLFLSLLITIWIFLYFTNVLQIGCAHAVGKWYFDKESKGKIGAGVISYGIALFWHSGTAAFGALVMGVVYLLQYVVDGMNWLASTDNSVLQCIAKCMQVVLFCVKLLLELASQVNACAFAFCGLRGTSFCSSAMTAFSACATNLDRFAVLAGVTYAVRTLGLLLAAGSGVAVTYLCLKDDDLEESTGPLVVAGLVCALTADTLMSLITATTNALFFCFVADEAVAKKKGLPKGESTPEELVDLFEQTKNMDAKKEDAV